MAQSHSVTNTARPATAADIHQVMLINNRNEVLDIQPVLIEFNVFEDIYYPFMRANFTVLESNDIVNSLPLTGDEFVTLSFSTPGSTEVNEYVFSVYSIKGRKKQQERSEVYVIEAYSMEYLKNIRTRINKSYVGLASDMVSAIYNEYLKVNDFKTLFVEPTLGNIYLAPCNKHPFDYINLISNFAGASTDYSSYMFFENTDGFQFVNLYTLLNQTPKAKYTYGEFDVNLRQHNREQQALKREVVDPFYTLLSYNVKRDFDVSEGLRGGTFGQKVSVVDPVSKQFTQTVHTYDDLFAGGPTLTKNKPITDISELVDKQGQTFDRYILSNLADYDVSADTDKQLHFKTTRHQHVAQRHFQLEKQHYMEFDCVAPGNNELWAGDIVEIYVPSSSVFKSQRTEYDRRYGQNPQTARFFVTAVKHSFNNLDKRYMTTFVGAKDSYGYDVNNSKPPRDL